MKLSDIVINEPYGITPTEAVYEAKSLLGEHKPYYTKTKSDGSPMIIFNDHFLRMVKRALDNDCIDGMSKREATFWLGYSAYSSDMIDGGRDDIIYDMSEIQQPKNELEQAYADMSVWLADEVAGNEHPTITC